VDRERFTFRGEKRSQLAEFFARLHKPAGLMKTRSCAFVTFVTLGAHPYRLAQWQNVSTRSWCCTAAGAPRAYRAGVYEGIAETGLNVSPPRRRRHLASRAFFVPRQPPACLAPNGTPEALGVYDTSPLKETLQER